MRSLVPRTIGGILTQLLFRFDTPFIDFGLTPTYSSLLPVAECHCSTRFTVKDYSEALYMSDPVKLVVVVDEMELGGAQRQISYLLHNIDRRKVSPHLIYFRNSSHLVESLVAAGIPVTLVEKQGALDLKFIWTLMKTLRGLEYDILHGFNVTAEFWSLLCHRLIRKGIFVSSVRCLFDVLASREQKMKPFVTRNSDFVIANSRSGLNSLREQVSLADDRATVVYNGIGEQQRQSPEQRQRARSVAGYGAENLTLCIVCRLVPSKNTSMMLKALAQLAPEKLDQLTVIVVGDGPELENLREQAKASLSEVVHFVGESNDVDQWYRMSDVFVQTSDSEGLSNTVMEAMSHGLAVIATDVGGTNELITNDVEGYLIKKNDHVALAAKIDQLLDQPEVVNTLGCQAVVKIEERFALQTMVSKFESTYQQLLQR